MIYHHKKTLSNGLTVIINEDFSTPMVSLNILYDVGSKDEHPEKTGFAHLFEHLMFEGSKNVPDFDIALQKAGGENNAFTTNDLTNYYCTLPAQNIETALWIESDRMFLLDVTQEKLDIQKSVVIEEFKQRYLNKPYGDVWLLIHPLVYKVHPYQWDTIGKDISHIEKATLNDVQSFYNKHYDPANAILCISGNIKAEKGFELVEKWFGDIPSKGKYKRNLPKEPSQTEKRVLEVTRDVPNDVIYYCYRISGKNNLQKFYATALLQDILSYGESSRLHQSLVKDKKIFISASALITDTIDDGILIIKGKLVSDKTIEEGEKAIQEEIEKLLNDGVNEKELQRIKNAVETSNTLQEMMVSAKSFSLSYYTLLGDTELINKEKEIIDAINTTDVQNIAKEIFTDNNLSVLHYLRKN
ncbi:MAG: insulinase family protein [Bacteroidia bacterium]|nr:insulinase family protein [Bacteroidia bacterium]